MRSLPIPACCLRVDSKDYFSAHGSDALLIANEIYKTTNVIKYLGSTAISSKPGSSSAARGLPSVTISLTLTKAFLRECLTGKQMRVEIYEPEEGAAGRKIHTRWILGRSASPGNISQLEDMLFDRSDMLGNAVSMAVKLQIKEQQRIVGCAFVDVQEKMIGVAEFVDDDNFGNTEVSFCTGFGGQE